MSNLVHFGWFWLFFSVFLVIREFSTFSRIFPSNLNLFGFLPKFSGNLGLKVVLEFDKAKASFVSFGPFWAHVLRFSCFCGALICFGGSFSFSPHLQIFTCKFVDHIVRLLWKFTYRLMRPRQTYLVFILNLVKPLVTLINWNWREVGWNSRFGGNLLLFLGNFWSILGLVRSILVNFGYFFGFLD